MTLMYITNRPDVAKIAEAAGADRIFVDMEYIGKAFRQGGMDTVQNHHSPADVRAVKDAVKKAEVLCRVNPIHEAGAAYGSSREEIEDAISAGADILMLPYFKTTEEVRQFITAVGGRVKTMLLVETPEAAEHIDEILAVDGIDEVLIGLNDLSLGYGKKFMFELLADGTVETLCRKLEKAGIPYGFGGIAALGKGALPAEYIIREHYRLGSTCTILSRSFCNPDTAADLEEVRHTFVTGIREIRSLEEECKKHERDSDYFDENRKEVVRCVKMICEG